MALRLFLILFFGFLFALFQGLFFLRLGSYLIQPNWITLLVIYAALCFDSKTSFWATFLLCFFAEFLSLMKFGILSLILWQLFLFTHLLKPHIYSASVFIRSIWMALFGFCFQILFNLATSHTAFSFTTQKGVLFLFINTVAYFVFSLFLIWAFENSLRLGLSLFGGKASTVKGADLYQAQNKQKKYL